MAASLKTQDEPDVQTLPSRRGISARRGGNGGEHRPVKLFAVYLVAKGFKLEVVLGLQIAVNDPLVVRRRKAAGHLNRAFRRLAHRERAAREPFTQRLAIEQFHNRVGPPVVGAEIENRQDVRMRKRSDRFRFTLESRQSVDVLRKPGRKDLDGYVAIEASVPGIIDFAHPAGPKGRLDLVRAEARAGREGQTRGLYGRSRV